jgi:cytochrome c-type biogenesis protein CcmH
MSAPETHRPRRAPVSRFGDPAGRAALFAMAAIAALLLAVPFSMWLAMAPADQSQAERLGHEIGCVCGTCPLRPIATCGCGFADSMLVKLDQEVAAGRTDDEIMAVFVAEYGSQIKIKPEGSGVGLMAWLAPMALLMVGAVAMAAVISHWRGQQPAAEAASVTDGAAPQDPSAPPTDREQDRYRDIVERELDDLDV